LRIAVPPPNTIDTTDTTTLTIRAMLLTSTDHTESTTYNMAVRHLID